MRPAPGCSLELHLRRQRLEALQVPINERWFSLKDTARRHKRWGFSRNREIAKTQSLQKPDQISVLTSVWTGSTLTIHMPEEAWKG